MTQTTLSLPMDRDRFATGDTFAQYVETMSQNQRRIKQLYDLYSLTVDDVQALKQAVASHGGHLYVTALVEDWCPDVIFNVPLLQHMADAVDGFELRLFERPENPDIQEVYQAEKIHSIPVVSFFNQNWQEIGRFVERSKPAHKRREEWLTAQKVDLNALRQSDDPADKELLRKTFANLFVAGLGWYREGMWRESLREIIEIIS